MATRKICLNNFLIFALVWSVIHSQSHQTILKNAYTQNQDILTGLQSLCDTYAHLARLTSVGKTAGGSDIFGIHISDNIDSSEAGEPFAKFVANVHGNEPVGRELLLDFASYLLENYETGETRHIVDSLNIILVPAINLDGFNMASQGKCGGHSGMLNKNNVDINADFDLNGENLQPETQVGNN